MELPEHVHRITLSPGLLRRSRVDQLDMKPDPDISPSQQSRIAQLSGRELEFMDSRLLENCSANWRKMARIVGATQLDLTDEVENIPDLYLASRIRELIESGFLEYQGIPGNMRYCEVRIAADELAPDVSNLLRR